MRRRIVVLVGATTSIVLLAFTLPLILLVRDVATNAALQRATTITQSLVPLVANGTAIDIALALDSLQTPGGTTVSVVLTNGQTLGAPRPRDGALDSVRAGGPAGIFATADKGRVVLQPVFSASGVRVVAVDITRESLTKGWEKAAVVIVLLAIALFVASLFIADRIARTLTRPLRELERTANELADGDFSARANVNEPIEIAHVGSAMNALARRIGELVTAEREAVADLSHRLRTPLTALRLDADSLSAPEERDRIAADVDLLERSLDDVIRTASRPMTSTLVPVCNASAVVADRVAFWSALAEEQGREVATSIPSAALWVGATEDDLAAAVDALLGNVFAHTDEGTAFSVRVHSLANLDGLIEVLISDEGPGLPTGVSVSGRGVSGSGSTGLGLDIARRIAESTGGSLALDSIDPHGTQVRLQLGVTTPPD